MVSLTHTKKEDNTQQTKVDDYKPSQQQEVVLPELVYFYPNF